MSSFSIGDLANSLILQRRGSVLKTELSRLTQELASGQISDVKSVLAGNFSYLSDIEKNMTVLSGYKVASTEASQFAGAMQSVLENVQDLSNDFAIDLISVASGGLDVVAQQSAAEARQHLHSIVSALNINSSGRSLFSGTATDIAPLASADDILDGLRTELTGVSGFSAKIAAAEAWFADPAGFDAVIYQGSNNAMSPFQLSDSDELSFDLQANSSELKEVMLRVALAGLTDDPSLGINTEERSELLLRSGEALIVNQDKLTVTRANIGFAEARIDQISTRNAAEMTSLEFAKGSLLEADPFETVTRLEEVQFQLQSLYTVTARSSELKLVNFL